MLIKLIKRKGLKMICKNEYGRSMVEMLGVLAIIGVLSVAGILGYTIAMRKHRANEIAQAISILAIAAKTANSGTGIENKAGGTDYTELLDTSHQPAGIDSLTVNPSEYGYTITLDTEVPEVCEAVATTIGNNSDNPLYYQGAGCSNSGQLNVIAK